MVTVTCYVLAFAGCIFLSPHAFTDGFGFLESYTQVEESGHVFQGPDACIGVGPLIINCLCTCLVVLLASLGLNQMSGRVSNKGGVWCVFFSRSI